eukprot:GDKJ01029119.1.p1 GENE.GDKJ01029119.1~~GDKJ01029119.1.p1  ORF type:complete len:302 (-),score=85.38 GDKJ01029119.1:130-1008(-)
MSKEQLTPVESLRIKFLVEDAIEKLNFLTILPNQSTGGELSKAVAEEIAKSIESQKLKKEQYAELMNKRDGERGLTKRNAYQKSQEELNNLAEQLSISSKQLCRHLDNAPNEELNLQKVHDEKKTVIAWLSQLCQEVVENQTFSLVTQHAEERKKQSELLQELKKKEKDKASEVRVVDMTLKNAQAEFDKSVMADEALIQSLMAELKQLKSEAAMRIALETKKYRAHEATMTTIREQKERELEKRVLLLEEENARLRSSLESTKKIFSKQTSEIVSALNMYPLRDFEAKQMM